MGTHTIRPAAAAVVLIMALGGCLRRAPTNYELDKRAGQPTPPAEPQYESDERRRRHPSFDEPLNTTSTIAPAPMMPARTAPVIRRVWVADQALPDGSWLQGTWWYIEVEPSRWLYEVDPGSAPFAEPVPELPPARKRERRHGERGRHDERGPDADGVSALEPSGGVGASAPAGPANTGELANGDELADGDELANVGGLPRSGEAP